MGKKANNKKKGKGAEKTAMKTDKKLQAKQKKMLEKIGEVRGYVHLLVNCMDLLKGYFLLFILQADIVDIVEKLEENEKRRLIVSESVVSPPSPRSNFSFCSHPDKEELILFGGEFYNGQTLSVFNELYFYSIGKKEWKLVMAPGGPGPRSSHQMVSVAADGGQLWVIIRFFIRLSFNRFLRCHRLFIPTNNANLMLTTFSYSFSAASIQHHLKFNFITTKICGYTELQRANGKKWTHQMGQVLGAAIV